VLSYVLSHVAVWDNLRARTWLISTLDPVQDATKLTLFLPLINELLDSSQRAKVRSILGPRGVEDYGRLLLSSFNLSASALVNKDDSEAWNVLLHALQTAGQLILPS
jgi:hypothetical protein